MPQWQEMPSIVWVYAQGCRLVRHVSKQQRQFKRFAAHDVLGMCREPVLLSHCSRFWHMKTGNKHLLEELVHIEHSQGNGYRGRLLSESSQSIT